MSHNLDTTEGQTSFVSAREDAWHSLGTTLPDSFTAEQAMEHGLLGGWNVRKAPMTVAGTKVEVPDSYAVLRDNPVKRGTVDVLGTVGNQYTPIQNEEHAALLNALVDESGAHFETAGAIDGGRKVFITMKLPGHMLVGGKDQVDNYIAAVNTHDGSMAFTLMVTPVRIVCQNTLNIALGNTKRSFRIRHTKGANTAIYREARQALDLTFNYLDGFQADAERLINTEMDQLTFDKLIDREFGVDSDAPAPTRTRTDNKLQAMSELFTAQTQANIAGTAWAGLNALTEWADHYSPMRGDSRDAARHTKAVLDPGFKDRATRLMSGFASV